jgi:DNA-binding response OmpR family regulator
MGGAGRAPRVLVIEDYDDAREMYVEYLALSGYEVVAAEDGHAALRAANEAPPDLIVLDIALPKLDGLSVLRALRSQARFSATPVLTLSASIEGDYEGHALRAGATLALRKPLLPEDLMAAIRKTLK